MRQYNENIDPADSARQSSYPFATGTDMHIGQAELPAEYVRSIRLFCRPGQMLPAYINNVSAGQTASGQDVCTLRFSDAYGTVIGTAELLLLSVGPWTISPILTENGILAGHICYNELLPTLVFRAAKFSNSSAQAAIQLAPACCVPWVHGRAQSLNINGVSVVSDLIVKPGAYVHSEQPLPASGALAYSVVGDYQNPNHGHDGICQIRIDRLVNNNRVTGDLVYVGGKHLIIKHSKLSNARVTCDGTSIRLKGVKDE